MKTLNIGIIILLSFFLILVGCAKKDSKSSDSNSTTSTTTTDTDTDTTSTYTRDNTPAKSSVAVPASMSGSGSASRSSNAEGDPVQSSDAMFYGLVKVGVMMMKSSVSSADLNLMLADARYSVSDNDTCYEKNAYTVNFTQAMYNSVVNMEKEFGGDEGASGTMSAQFKQHIGKEINPPVAYKITTINEGGYTKQLKVGDSCSAITSGSGVETFRWDDNNTKLQVAFDDSVGDEVMKGSFSYDDTKKKSVIKMTFKVGTDKQTINFNISECSSSQKSGMSGDCAIFGFGMKFAMSGGATAMIKGSGKADDSGGYGEADMGFKSGAMSMTQKYKEKWDGKGNLTYVSASTDGGSTWSTSGTSDDTYTESSGYEAQPYSVSVEVSGSTYTEEGSYHIVLDDKNPNTYPEAVVGYGEIRGSQTFWDFWGADSTATHDLWEIPSSGDMEEVSSAAITITAN